MALTLLVEPDPGGHRFQAVANLALFAGRTDDILLLTSVGATQTDAFGIFLSDVELKVRECFSEIYPPTREMASIVADVCRNQVVASVVVMDADQSLKRWWHVAAKQFRGLPRRPHVIFMLTRYPSKLGLTDTFGWKLRLAKGTLALLAMATGTLHRVAGFAGRDDMSRGWLVKRARDPSVCSAHSRDRTRLRIEYDLPAERRLVGIFGVISERKFAPLVLDAALATSADIDLLLAGSIDPVVRAWLDRLSPAHFARVLVRPGFLPDEELDCLVAAVDVVALAMTNNGPSGIMGKALAAAVPVVSAGSTVRARELLATDNGEPAELTVPSFAAALGRVLARDSAAQRTRTVPPATGEQFAAAVLGRSYAAARSTESGR